MIRTIRAGWFSEGIGGIDYYVILSACGGASADPLAGSASGAATPAAMAPAAQSTAPTPVTDFAHRNNCYYQHQEALRLPLCVRQLILRRKHRAQ